MSSRRNSSRRRLPCSWLCKSRTKRGQALCLPFLFSVPYDAAAMQLTDIFDLSLVGRATVAALDYERADGTTATLTFGELDARSNRVARLLAARGLARGDRLG